MSEARRRPKDRKAQIAVAAADAFSELGFHAVSMEDIAARVGVSAAALYRHSPSKYQLLRDAVFTLSGQLIDGTAFADGRDPHAGAVELFDELVGALIDVAIANRGSGGVYRWGGRYLHDDDRAALLAQMATVHERLQRPIRVLRPELDPWQCSVLSVSVISVIGSIVDQRTVLSAARIHARFAEVTRALLRAQVPERGVGGAVEGGVAAMVDPGRYEAVLRESMALFHRRGYRETTVEEIAKAVGMPASGIYRYFPHKTDILAALFRRAADRLSADTAEIFASESDPVVALDRMISSYVSRSFTSPEIDYLYFTERTNLPPADRTLLHNLQRATVETWVRLVIGLHPELSAREGRFIVHAAFAVVVDLGRMMRYENAAAVRSMVCTLMRVTLMAPAEVLLVADG